MSDGIEKTLGLSPLSEIIDENDNEMETDNTEYDDEHNDISAIANVKHTGNFLGVNVDNHEKEIDDIRRKALNAFKDVMVVGQNVDPVRSARLFEVAGQFLKTARDTTDDKLKRDIEIAKLKIQAKKAQSADGISESLSNGAEIMADRNDLLREMIKQSSGRIIDGEASDDDDNGTVY